MSDPEAGNGRGLGSSWDIAKSTRGFSVERKSGRPSRSRVSAYGDKTELLTARRASVFSATKKAARQSVIARDIGGKVDVKHNGEDLFAGYTKKPSNDKFRWNLLWLLLLLIGPFPLWLTFVDCKLSLEIQFIIACFFNFNYVLCAIYCWMYMWRMLRAFNLPFYEETDPDARDQIQHICVMPTYKEPVALLKQTMSSVANQTVADSIVMVVGMEEGTPDKEERISSIRERFDGSFKSLVFTVHPKTAGEITGACSNRNYAAREAVKSMLRDGHILVDPQTFEADVSKTILTVCDADTTFYYKYFENLMWSFCKEPESSRYEVVWQSPLFYNIALDERYFFTRVMGILRSFFMIGFLIGMNINTMSIYSVSLSLICRGHFFHPYYQMDDIIYTLSAMKATGKRIEIRFIDIPTLSGPTSGPTMMEEWNEWVVQATRWTIGAAEVFHYFFYKLLRRTYLMPGLIYFFWFVYYYGFVLCMGGIIQITGIIMALVSIGNPSISAETCKPFGQLANENTNWAWLMNVNILLFYCIVPTTAFAMDAIVAQILALDENVNPIRNLFHFVTTMPVQWAYCLVECKAIIEIAIHGKSVCGHKASDKSNLAS